MPPLFVCDAKMYHMKASVRDLRYRFSKIEDLLGEGHEIEITKRKRVIARLVPPLAPAKSKRPDFLARLKKIYGKKVLAVSGLELLNTERDRY
jgi:antitoxin (DNA-binding transcriptional repressor) of toxin-antitoxin stability system